MEDYVELGEVGKGSYGTVFKCQHKVTGKIVAIKQLKDEEKNDQMRKTALREAKILRQLQHPNVVRLLELFRSKTKLFMVFEFVDRSILRLLEHNPRGLPILEVKKIMWQLILALNFLHAQKIIHRDLKPENILMDDLGTVKLADFGLARPQAPGQRNLSPYVATRWYRAPELLVGDTYGPGVDVWALGCLLIELTTGQPLFPGKTNADQLWLILRSVGCSTRQLSRLQTVPNLKGMTLPNEEELVPLDKRYSQLDRTTMMLLKACLRPEPRERPTCTQLLTHEYFTPVAPLLQPYTSVAEKAVVTHPMKGSEQLALEEPPAHTTSVATKAAATVAGIREGLLAHTPGRQTQSHQHGAAQHPSGEHATAGVQPTHPANAGGSQGSDLDVKIVTGSEDGLGLVEEEDQGENEAGQLSAAARERIMKWLDDLPDPVKERARQAVISDQAGVATSSQTVNAVSPTNPGSMQLHAHSLNVSTSVLPTPASPQGLPPIPPAQHTSHQKAGANSPLISNSIQPPPRLTAPQGGASPVTRSPSARNVFSQHPGILSAEPVSVQSLLNAHRVSGGGGLNRVSGGGGGLRSPACGSCARTSLPTRLVVPEDGSLENLVSMNLGPRRVLSNTRATEFNAVQSPGMGIFPLSPSSAAATKQQFDELAKALGVTGSLASPQQYMLDNVLSWTPTTGDRSSTQLYTSSPNMLPCDPASPALLHSHPDPSILDTVMSDMMPVHHSAPVLNVLAAKPKVDGKQSNIAPTPVAASKAGCVSAPLSEKGTVVSPVSPPPFKVAGTLSLTSKRPSLPSRPSNTAAPAAQASNATDAAATHDDGKTSQPQEGKTYVKILSQFNQGRQALLRKL